MSSKTYTGKVLNSRPSDTLKNKLVSVINRLKCGQDGAPNSFACSGGQPAVGATALQAAVPVSRCSADASLKNLNDYFEQWQKDTLFEDDEHADLFCICRMVSDVIEHRLRGLATVKPEPRSQSKEEVNTLPDTVKNGDGQQSDTRQSENNNGSISASGAEMVRIETVPHISPADNDKKRQKKKKHHKKKTAHFTSTAGSDISSVNGNATTLSGKINKLTQAVYPGVNCGHKSCIPLPIVTPRNIGWLWSLKETGGVKINRNWRPGAIPRNVAVIMEKARTGTMHDISSLSLLSTVKKPPNVTKPLLAAKIDQQQHPMLTTTAPPNLNKFTSSPDLVTTPVIKKPNATKQWSDRGEPVLSVNKHKGEYGIKMNPVSFRNSKGELVCPKNVEPVCIKLGKRTGGTLSSQSSLDLIVPSPYGHGETKY